MHSCQRCVGPLNSFRFPILDFQFGFLTCEFLEKLANFYQVLAFRLYSFLLVFITMSDFRFAVCCLLSGPFPFVGHNRGGTISPLLSTFCIVKKQRKQRKQAAALNNTMANTTLVNVDDQTAPKLVQFISSLLENEGEGKEQAMLDQGT